MRRKLRRVVFGGWALWLGCGAVVGQQYVISTVAGGAPPPTPVAGTSTSITGPYGLAVDGAGNAYFTSWVSSVLRLDVNGVITRVAGNGRAGYSGDGGPGTNSQLFLPVGVTVDVLGNVFIADTSNNCVRKVAPGGVVVTVAGTGMLGYSGDGGPATSAKLNQPQSVAVDGQGNLYVGDIGNERVRKVSPAGIITTVAGVGTFGYSGDGGPATSSQLGGPLGVAVDRAGNLYIADAFNYRIRKVSSGGIISTVAGTGTFGYSGDGGPATGAQLNFPNGVAVDGQGNLWITDSNRIRKVSPSGIITTVAGTGTQGFAGDGGPAINAQLNSPQGVAIDGQGNLFIADNYNSRIRKISPDGVISTVAGNGTREYSGDNGLATSAVSNK